MSGLYERTPMPRPDWIPLLTPLRINLCAGLVLGLLALAWRPMPGGSGLAPYFAFLADHAVPGDALVRLAVWLMGGAVLIELVVRLGQLGLGVLLGEGRGGGSGWRALLVLGLPGLVSGLPHLVMGWPAALAHCVLGLYAAWWYGRGGPLWPHLLWALQYPLVGVGVFVVTATYLFGPGGTHLCFQYKAEQVAKGDIYYLAGWGWIDRHHMRAHEIMRLKERLMRSEGQLVEVWVRESLSTAEGGNVSYRRRYEIDVPEGVGEEAAQAMAGGAFLDSAVRHEALQARLPPFSGGRLSAYAAEDIPSMMYAVVLSAPGLGEHVVRERLPLGEAVRRWELEGLAFSALRIRRPGQFEPEGREQRELWREAERRLDRVGDRVRYMDEETPYGIWTIE
jgi:hypothetical protein